jgi:hypothetical protein
MLLGASVDNSSARSRLQFFPHSKAELSNEVMAKTQENHNRGHFSGNDLGSSWDT